MTNLPADLGPIYAETHMGRFPVEPFNTASNLAFLLVILLLLLRLRREGRRGHGITLLALGIIGVGFTGGTLYHATRAWDLWRLLDIFPILLVVLTASVYFSYALLGSLWRVLLVLLLPILGYRLLLASRVAEALQGVAHGYLFLATLVLLPAFLHCAVRRWRNGGLLLLAAGCFGFAFLSREVDEAPWVRGLLPMGTHFFWHLGGAAAAYFALSYLFSAERARAATAPGAPF